MSAMKKLKQAWDENPLAVIGVATAALAATGKIIDAVSAAQSRKAYSQQIRHKTQKSK